MQKESNIIVELSKFNTNTGFGYNFNIPDNYVIYFEKEQDKELSFYVRCNYEMLKTKFAAKDLNFIYFPLIPTSSTKIQELISYYFPQLNHYLLPEKVAEHFNEKMLSQIFNNFQEEISFISDKNEYVPAQIKSEELLNLLDFKSNINSGLLFLNMTRE